jgi:hypothetical protein
LPLRQKGVIEMSKHILLVLAAAVAVVGFVAASAQATVIVVTPTDADNSSVVTSDYTAKGKLITNWWANLNGGAGLNPWNGSTTDHNQPAGDPQNWGIPSAYAMGWLSNSSGVANQWIWLDLGQSKSVNKIDVWNFFQSGQTSVECLSRGTKSFEIWASNSSKTADGTAALATINLTRQATEPSTSSPIPCQQFTFSATGQYFLLKNFVNWSGWDRGTVVSNYVGLGEVRFEGVPEPGTLALLAAGLVGLLCYAWRKRK